MVQYDSFWLIQAGAHVGQLVIDINGEMASRPKEGELYLTLEAAREALIDQRAEIAALVALHQPPATPEEKMRGSSMADDQRKAQAWDDARVLAMTGDFGALGQFVRQDGYSATERRILGWYRWPAAPEAEDAGREAAIRAAQAVIVGALGEFLSWSQRKGVCVAGSILYKRKAELTDALATLDQAARREA